ncbi:DUF1003 domain-containing protein [Pontibacter diazotrophicus]|uniref:DUF1003 domain-containing protein n=1 Tax=Pontibacter diazotrophicus TaxID=1400979 RepID=A0A3D8LG02_9BACT|nr:DUF1003 domain-containing protein [Pontibacter diazotrophicus]RDV16337.1 DUF1003 domain-containing protein [Pontibacter diazotrophicus]
MKKHHALTGVCHITHKQLPLRHLILGSSIRKNIFDLVKTDHPDFDERSYITLEQLGVYRKRYLEQLLIREMGELTTVEQEVIKSISGQELVTSNIEGELAENISLGDRMADNIASFGGSWRFITLFFSFLLLWMLVNVYVLSVRPFDPYPFILLNLILSCLAAIQAPIIMMSQNRKESKDRQRSEYDYKVNLKAELEIRLLHEKVDHLIVHQNQRLMEIQQIQVDLLEDIMARSKA